MEHRQTLENTEKGLVVRLKIIPNSSRNEVILGSKCNNQCNANEELKIKITAQPVENKANKALIEFLAKKLRTAKSNIQIIKGELSKEKTLLIQGINEETFKEKLF